MEVWVSALKGKKVGRFIPISPVSYLCASGKTLFEYDSEVSDCVEVFEAEHPIAQVIPFAEGLVLLFTNISTYIYSMKQRKAWYVAKTERSSFQTYCVCLDN